MSSVETVAYLDTPEGRREITAILDYHTATDHHETLRSALVTYPGAPDDMWVNAAALSYQQYRTVDCDRCDGDGVIVTRHRLWGHLECPEPTEEERCGYCGETGYHRIPFTMAS